MSVECGLKQIWRVVVAFAMASGASFASAVVMPLWYSTSIDLGARTATFSIQFNARPDFFTTSAHGQQADAFQFWVDSQAPDPFTRTYDALFGKLPGDTQTVISAREMPGLNTVELIWPKPLTWVGERDRGGWGTVEGRVPYTLTNDNLFSFDVPLALLHETDGLFFYRLETYSYGDIVGLFRDGVSGRQYWLAVPEPSTHALILVALVVFGGLAWSRNRTMKSSGSRCSLV